MVNQVMFRASVVRMTDRWGEVDPYWRWTIPVLFQSWEAAGDAAVKAAKRKIERHGGEWTVEIERERVVIV